MDANNMNPWEEYAMLTLEIKIYTERLRELEPLLVKERSSIANQLKNINKGDNSKEEDQNA